MKLGNANHDFQISEYYKADLDRQEKCWYWSEAVKDHDYNYIIIIIFTNNLVAVFGDQLWRLDAKPVRWVSFHLPSILNT